MTSEFMAMKFLPVNGSLLQLMQQLAQSAVLPAEPHTNGKCVAWPALAQEVTPNGAI